MKSGTKEYFKPKTEIRCYHCREVIEKWDKRMLCVLPNLRHGQFGQAPCCLKCKKEMEIN